METASTTTTSRPATAAGTWPPPARRSNRASTSPTASASAARSTSPHQDPSPTPAPSPSGAPAHPFRDQPPPRSGASARFVSLLLVQGAGPGDVQGAPRRPADEVLQEQRGIDGSAVPASRVL